MEGGGGRGEEGRDRLRERGKKNVWQTRNKYQKVQENNEKKNGEMLPGAWV